MIVLDKPKLRFLLAGRTITVTVNHDRHRRGRSYSVSTAHNKPASCTATVVGIKVTASGREIQIKQNRDKPIPMLASSVIRGHTYDPMRAPQGERDGMVDGPELERMTREARERDAERSKTQRASTPIDQQVRDLQRRADSGDQQAKRHLFMVKKHLDEAAKQKARDAA